MRLLATLLVGMIALFGWLSVVQPQTARALMRYPGDLFDQRPVRHILILGNSRTYFNDMPDMIRDMADSAGDKQRYDITVDALPGGSFEMLWNDATAQSLLARQWDDMVLQSESRAQSSTALEQSFETYGEKLIRAAHLKNGAPLLVVNWNYDAGLWGDTDPDGRGHDEYYREIQANTTALGKKTGANLVNVGELWAEFMRDHPNVKMTMDGNHPTLAGSTLFALLLYADLSRRDVGTVTYCPSGLDPATFSLLRQSVQQYQQFSS